MNTKYRDLIDQTYEFPQSEFNLDNNSLKFHDIPLLQMVELYGTPLKFTYLPKISDNIQRAKTWFAEAKTKYNYRGDYKYCYCTKSCHLSYVLNEVARHKVHDHTQKNRADECPCQNP